MSRGKIWGEGEVLGTRGQHDFCLSRMLPPDSSSSVSGDLFSSGKNAAHSRTDMAVAVT